MTWTKPQENCQLSSITCQSYWFTKHIVTIFISFYSLFIVSHRPNSSLGIAPTSPLGTTSHIGGASHSNIETARPAWRVSSVLRCRCNFCWEKTKAFIWHTVKHPLRTDVLFIRWSDLFFHQQDIGKGTSIMMLTSIVWVISCFFWTGLLMVSIRGTFFRDETTNHSMSIRPQTTWKKAEY